MKKILLATTALTLSAGVAAADVTVSGDARMGVIYDSSLNANSRLSFTNRVRVSFAMAGETDGGLAFGASIRADNAPAGAAGTAGSVFVSGAFGKLSMGDVDNAFKKLYGNLSGVGLTGLGDHNELSHSADGGAFVLGTANATALGLVNIADSPLGVAAPIQRVLNSVFTQDPAAPTDYIASLSDIEDGFNAILSQNFVAENFDIAAFTAEMGGTVTGDELRIAGALPSDARFNNSVLAGLGLATGASGVLTAADVAALEALFGRVGTDLIGLDAGGAVLGADLAVASDIRWASTATLTTAPIEARVLYEYSIEDFKFAFGYSQTGANTGASIAAAYTFSGLTLSAGYAQATWRDAYRASFTGTVAANPTGTLADGTVVGDTATATFASTVQDVSARDINLGVKYTMDALSMGAVYQDKRFKIGNVEVDKQRTLGVSVAYAMDGLGLSAYATQTKSDLAVQNARAYGVGASYDLGGGAKVVGGVVNTRGFTGGSTTKADFGLAFTF